MIKILGIVDIIIGIFLLLAFFSLHLNSLLIIFAFYLLVKFILFSMEGFYLANFIDIFAAATIFASLAFTLPKILFLIAALLILQKGFFSLF